MLVFISLHRAKRRRKYGIQGFRAEGLTGHETPLLCRLTFTTFLSIYPRRCLGLVCAAPRRLLSWLFKADYLPLLGPHLFLSVYQFQSVTR